MNQTSSHDFHGNFDLNIFIKHRVNSAHISYYDTLLKNLNDATYLAT